MTILQGTMQDGTVIPVQVDAQGRLVAEGLQGQPGPQGPQGQPGPQGPQGSGSVPAGAVITTAASTAPSGFMKCDGSTVDRSTYAALFAAIGTQYGAGDGSTTFQLPDLRGEFIRGWDDGRGVDSGRSLGSAQGQSTARPNNAYTTSSSGNHTHSHNRANLTANQANNQSYDKIAPSGAPYTTDTTSAAGDHTHTITGGGDSETRPRNVALLYCIKY